MTHLFGWWDLDADGVRLVNRGTGQRVTYVGRVVADRSIALASTPNRYWMRFDYEDRECRYPLLVEWRNVLAERGLDYRPIVWRVDHLRSAAQWRREASTGAAHPSYGLWRRVDDCICDVFAIWPRLEQVGSAPEKLAINGGWRNGQWTGALFREVWCLPERDRKPYREPAFAPWMFALATAAPEPWEFVPAAGYDMAATPFDWGFLRLPDGRLHLPPGRPLRNIERSRPHLRSADGRQALVPLDPRKNRGSGDFSHTYHLLYVDDDIVCDALELAKPSDARGSTQSFWYGAVPGCLGEQECGFVARRESRLEELRAVSFKVALLPNKTWWQPSPALWQRLAWAVRDAWPAWAGASLNLRDDARESDVQLNLPHANRVHTNGKVGSFPHLDLGSHATFVFSATSLEPTQKGKLSPMKFLFDEERDGILRVESRMRHIGWWDLDPEGPALVNRKSGQRLAFDGAVEMAGACHAEPAPPVRKSLRFTYSDSDTRYPLLVEDWKLDHRRSAELWRAETNAGAPHPPYGLWRRVDECALDALLCWPELEATGPKQSGCAAIGAWLNGAWDPGAARSVFASSRDLKTGAEPAVDPVLEPIDCPPPQPWRYVDAPEVARHAELAHVERWSDELLYLPADAPLTGFEQQVPHLRRADGRAVMFPSHLFSGFDGRDGGYSATPYFTYADEDVLLSLGRIREWVFDAFLIWEVGGRHPAAGPFAIAAATPSFKRRDFLKYPASYPYWRRILSALVDGWLAWPGTERRMLDDPAFIARERTGRQVPAWEKSGASLARADAVRIEGGYVGGIYTISWRLNAQDGARRAQAERSAPLYKKVTDHLKCVMRAMSEQGDIRPQ